jgi:hypothetical protein
MLTSAVQQEINRSLLDPPGKSTREYIVAQLWNNNHRRLQDSCCNTNFSAYWEYYSIQCRQALHDNGRHISARTHKDILDIASYLKKNCYRQEICKYLRPTLSSAASCNSDSLLDRSIELTARLLLMIEFGSQIYGFSGHTELIWDDSSSLEDFVGRYFKHPPVLGNEGVKLYRTFNAHSIQRIAGIKIVWTNNLVDHLRLTDDDSTVEIFHHATFLHAQLER